MIEKSIKSNLMNPSLIVLIAFFSSFKNAQLHLIGNKPSISLAIDYFFFVFVALCLVWILFQAFKQKKISRMVVYFIPLLIWVISKSLILTFFSEGEHIPRTLITSFMAMSVIVLGVNDSNNFRKVIWAFGIGAMLSSLISLILYPEMIGYRYTQVYGVTYNGGIWNYSLISFVSVSWIMVALVSDKSKKSSKNLAMFIICITAVGSLSGLSRGFILVVGFSIVAYLIYSRKIKMFFLISIFIALGAYIIPVLFPFILSQYQERFAGGASLIQDQSRFEIWKFYIGKFSEYYIAGALGNYREYDPDLKGPHSVFLNWLVQYGLIGLVGFIYLLIGMLKTINKVKVKSRIQAAALIAWLVSYLSLASINQTGFLELSIFVAYGIILSWTNLYEY